MSEAGTQSRVRLAAAQLGFHLWRNNSGAGKIITDKGESRFIRWGLANDSEALNKRLKSSDLIGIVPVTITPDMVGKTIGVFGAVEIKDVGWRYNPNNEREVAQLAFIELVRTLGGRAEFITDPHDLVKLIRPA